MIWHSAAQFLAMGGYALYVWGSVAACMAAIAAELAALGQRRRAAMRMLRQQGAVRRIERAERGLGAERELAVPLQREAA